MKPMRKEILPMPKCFDKDCKEGVTQKLENGVMVFQVCPKCSQMEKDLLESPDYDVTVVNGKVEGYELIEK